MIFASKDQLNGGGGVGGGLVTAESGITTNHIYSSQPIQDNIAAESEVAKRGAASVSSTSSASGSESQGQSSQIDVGKHIFSALVQCLHCCMAQWQRLTQLTPSWWMCIHYSNFLVAISSSPFLFVCVAGTNSASSGSNGVISFGTPNSFQQYYSPTFGQFGAIYAATLLPSGSSTTPQVTSPTFH